MIVYVEYVLVDNLFLDMLLAYVCMLLCKTRPSFWRVFFSAAVGTALVFPFLYIKPVWARLLYKVAVLLAVCLPLSFSRKQLRKHLVVYTLLSASVGGFYYLITGISVSPSYGVVHTSGGKLGLVAGCALIAVYLIRQLFGIVVNKIHRQNAVKVELPSRLGPRFISGYYDSGNRATAQNGRGILFLSPEIRGEIEAEPTGEDILVKTIGGKNMVSLYRIESVTIFSKGKTHTIEQVNAAYAFEKIGDYEALLPYNL